MQLLQLMQSLQKAPEHVDDVGERRTRPLASVQTVCRYLQQSVRQTGRRLVRNDRSVARAAGRAPRALRSGRAGQALPEAARTHTARHVDNLFSAAASSALAFCLHTACHLSEFLSSPAIHSSLLCHVPLVLRCRCTLVNDPDRWPLPLLTCWKYF